MKFKFIGNPHAMDSRGDITAFGVYFPLNIEVDVTDAHAIKKLMGNAHFAISDGGKTYHQAPKLILPEDDSKITVSESDIEAEVARRIQALREGSVGYKTELLAKAAAAGVTVDKRWNAQRIAEAIEAAGKMESAE